MSEFINVKSEIGRLRRVMLHRPGIELQNLMPDYLERPFFYRLQLDHIDSIRVCKAGCDMSNLAGMGTVPDRHSAPRGFPGRRINVAGPESRLPAVNPGRCRSKGPTAQGYAAFDSGIGIMS